ncbi:MAG: DEAD/DEAH box helicase, partial [Pseudonocardiaceae bacterium]
PADADPDALFEAFAAWADGRGLTLYPAQEEALIEIVSGANVILSTPTGSGKSLVAIGAHFAALAAGKRTYYTAPIKALVSEKFFSLVDIFGASSVGMMTGDSSVNADAPIICCTAEILANIALRTGPEAREDTVGQVVMDEFHFYAEPDRGWAWQVPLLELPKAQFVLMSATLGDVAFFEKDLTTRTGGSTAVVTSAERPVPLTYRYALTPLHETIDELLAGGQAPVYVVHFSQAAAIERAQALMSINVCTKSEKSAIADLIGDFRFSAGFGRTLSRLVRHGIGVHHAGMLPKYRRLVEQLAQAGLLKVICGTDTLGVGINVPIRTVVLTALTKYDGVRMRHLKAREFHQIAGRAGRAGYDTDGYVVVQAPDHVIENAKALAKAGDDAKKKRKIVRKKAPEGFVNWTESTYERLIAADPEPLVSSFAVSHSMLLNVIGRPGNAVDAMRHLLEGNHEPRARQRQHILRAIAIYRGLRAAGVVEQLAEPDGQGRMVRLTVDLQFDFALNQPLSPFALAAIELLDPESPSYALDVVSIIESTVEDPRQVLSQQKFKARGEAVAVMKAGGVEYDERMELLDGVTYPMPLVELLDAAFATYRQGHPWVADTLPSPKSVVRDMYERAMNFVEYIGFYTLARSEGLVLRYLTDVYDSLRHTVPDDAKTEPLADLIEWLGELVRQVDSSLLDEWEALRHPADDAVVTRPEPHAPRPVTGNERAFRVLVRNELFRRVELAARRSYAELGELDGASGWDAEAWEDALADGYFAEYDAIGTGHDARGPALIAIDVEPELWRV